LVSTHADVAVVGGGIIGSCTAFYLAKSGADVLVLDPAPGTGASAGNAGMLVPSQSVPFANPATAGAWLGALAKRDSFVTLRRPLSPSLLPWVAGSMFAARPWRASRGTRLLYHLARKSLQLYEELTEAEGIDLRLRSSGSLRVFRSASAFRQQSRMVRTLARLGAECKLLDPRNGSSSPPARPARGSGGSSGPGSRCGPVTG
jgi:D-amino-acid dehydrogenase